MQVFLDSPLAAKLTSVYEKYAKNGKYFNKEAIKLGRADDIFEFPGLRLTESPEASIAIAEAPSPKIIIAGAGMSNGGRIQHHEKRYLGDARNTILFVGYQAEGSLGRKILEGDKTVSIHGENISVRARVEAIGAYSAHADQPAIVEWLRETHESLKKVFLVHGEEDQMDALAGKIRDELAVEVEIPREGDEVIL